MHDNDFHFVAARITPELSLIGPIFVVIRLPSKDLTVFQKSLAEVASLNFDSH